MGGRNRWLAFAGVMIVAAILVAINLWLHSGPGSYRLAAESIPINTSMLARSEGVLHGQANSDGTACLWLGNGSGARALFWPYRFTAGGFPLSLYDDSGKRVATIGQYVVLAGALMPDDVHSITGCTGFTNFWVVGFVAEVR
jgi:hypothetical protein